MEKQNDFYCYSPRMMHYLKACGLDYKENGYNKRSKSPYYTFERSNKLEHALNGWGEFKKRQMEVQENG